MVKVPKGGDAEDIAWANDEELLRTIEELQDDLHGGTEASARQGGPGAMTRLIRTAPTDDPLKLLNRAERLVSEAVRSKREDRQQLREAAELTWLAASSAADVVADEMGWQQARGFSGRFFRSLEDEARISRDSLCDTFRYLRQTLHGRMFHDDEDVTEAGVRAGIAIVKDLVERTTRALDECSGD